MNYDEYLLNECYKHEDREIEERYKVFMIFVSGGYIEKPVWQDSDEDENRLKTTFDKIKYLYPKAEFGWVWSEDFDYRDAEHNYRLLEVIETYENI